MNSSGLTYKNIDELQSSSSIPRELSQKLERMKCDEIYNSFKKLIENARRSRGEVEVQYKYYMRSAEMAEIIRKHNGFSQFLTQKDKKLLFHGEFEECLHQLSDLQSLLMKKYDEQRLRNDKIERGNSIEPLEQDSNTFPSKNRSSSITIIPKDLIRMIEKESDKKSAIIFDYRQNKSEHIYYPKGNSITVVNIPFEIVTEAMIYSSIRNNLIVGERAFLNRLSDVDFVVLMDDDSAQLVNGQIKAGTKANFMYRALTDYIGSDIRLKDKPLFLEGGFKKWKMQYPTYVRGEPNENIRPPADEIDSVISKYRNDLSSMKFANLDDLDRKQSSTIPNENSVMRDSTNNQISAAKVPRRPQTHEPIFVKPTTPSTNNMQPMTPVETPITSTTINDLNFPNSAVPFPPPQISKPTAPLPDRSMKPKLIEKSSLSQITSTPLQPENRKSSISSNNSSRPTFNRATKPSFITDDHEQGLLRVYQTIMDSFEVSGSRWSQNKPGMTGLYNMGNTCFMSATLQCLFQTPLLIDVFTKENFLSKVNTNNKMGTSGVISAAFSVLIDIVWSGRFQAIRPKRFLELFAKEVNSSLADGEQHDASEFQLFLLDALHEDTNQVMKRISFEQNYKGGDRIANDANDFTNKNRQFSFSPVNKIFSILTVSELRCCKCSESSATFEDNTLLSVELLSSTNGGYILRDCLKSHFSQTKLDGDSRWNCPRCKTPQPAIKSTKLWSLPPVLVIHLKRFSLVNGDFVKNSAPVEFEINSFDPTNFLHNFTPARNDNTRYRLYGVTNHSGRLNSGHYTSIASHLREEKWYRFDDESVTQTSESAIDNRTAYILFYKKI